MRRVSARILAVRYRGQIARFRAALPDHRLLVQRGRYWDQIPPRRPAPSPMTVSCAWIVETGVRLGPLHERRVAWTERQDNRLPSPPVGEGSGERGESISPRPD